MLGSLSDLAMSPSASPPATHDSSNIQDPVCGDLLGAEGEIMGGSPVSRKAGTIFEELARLNPLLGDPLWLRCVWLTPWSAPAEAKPSAPHGRVTARSEVCAKLLHRSTARARMAAYECPRAPATWPALATTAPGSPWQRG